MEPRRFAEEKKMQMLEKHGEVGWFTQHPTAKNQLKLLKANIEQKHEKEKKVEEQAAAGESGA